MELLIEDLFWHIGYKAVYKERDGHIPVEGVIYPTPLDESRRKWTRVNDKWAEGAVYCIGYEDPANNALVRGQLLFPYRIDEIVLEKDKGQDIIKVEGIFAGSTIFNGQQAEVIRLLLDGYGLISKFIKSLII